MLVLKRRVGERLVLKVGTERIVVTLVKQDTKSSKIGIEAGRQVSVLRAELEKLEGAE